STTRPAACVKVPAWTWETARFMAWSSMVRRKDGSGNFIRAVYSTPSARSLPARDGQSPMARRRRCVIPAGRACEGEPGPIERRGRVQGLRDDPDVRQREDRAAPDDGAANGSRLGGRFAALAGMTAGEPRGRRQGDEGPRRRGRIEWPLPHHGFKTCMALTAAVARFSTPSLV